MFKNEEDLMTKRIGLSVVGYAIILIIILAFVMIISAPMLVEDLGKDGKKNNQEEVANEEVNSPENEYNRYLDENLINITDEMHNMENRLSSRIDNLEMQQNVPPQSPVEPSHISDSYICKIEGVQNEYGNTVPIARDADLSTQKIVFVCEYKK